MKSLRHCIRPYAANAEHPNHYCTANGMQTWDLMEETYGTKAVMDFCLCNVFKYIARCEKKNGFEDLRKAKVYIDKYIELAEKLNAQGYQE